ncbi:phosphoheptose isomerase [Hydrogenophaga sp. A37]|nr:phosphoheptose isomerase [Hydrogenophaga sp. A37]
MCQHLEVFQSLTHLQAEVEAAAGLWTACVAQGGKLMFCGNGGSAADSQHLAAELSGRLVEDRRPLAALALTTDSSALTCIANDYDFNTIFARQVEALGRPGDCLVAISTSGMSANVVRAAETASRLRMRTVGLLGRDGGRLAPLCDVSIVVPSWVTARVQEAHIFIGHTLCALMENRMARAGLL